MKQAIHSIHAEPNEKKKIAFQNDCDDYCINVALNVQLYDWSNRFDCAN